MGFKSETKYGNGINWKWKSNSSGFVEASERIGKEGQFTGKENENNDKVTLRL